MTTEKAPVTPRTKAGKALAEWSKHIAIRVYKSGRGIEEAVIGRGTEHASVNLARWAAKIEAEAASPSPEPLTVTTRPFTKDEVMALDAASPATGEGLDVERLARATAIESGYATAFDEPAADYHRTWARRVAQTYARLAATTPDTEEK